MNTTPKEQWLRQLRTVWEQKDTEELVTVWRQNNRQEWTDDAFEVIRQILLARVGSLPPQDGTSLNSKARAEGKTKRIVLLVALVSLPVIAYLFLTRPNPSFRVVQDEIRTIPLTQSTHPKRLVYENDIVIVSVGYDQFLEYIEQQLREHEDDRRVRGDYEQWRNTVQAELRDHDLVTLNKRGDEILIANVLEQGRASVFDKRNRSYAAVINVRIYGYFCGPLCGSGHRYFFLPDGNLFNPNGTQFLEVMDWIS